MIAIRQLSKSFGSLEVLNGIDLFFDKPGCVTAVLGPNGSGKTTLIKALLGLVIPEGGTIEVDGQDVRGQWDYRARISYLPQAARFPENLTVRELLAFIKDIRQGQQPREERFIRLFDLEPHLDKRLGTLSGGTRQKVNIALALMYDCPLWILDEPTNGLDPLAMVHFRELMQEARAQGKIVLITTHIMSLVEEIADEVVFLLEGKVYFQGTIHALKTQRNAQSVEQAIAGILSGQASFSANGHAPAARQLALSI